MAQGAFKGVVGFSVGFGFGVVWSTFSVMPSFISERDTCGVPVISGNIEGRGMIKKISVLACALIGASGLNAPAFAGQLQATRAISAPEGFSSACQRYSWLCSSRGGATMSDDKALELLSRVNRKVNSSIRPAEDSAVYGRSNYWSMPEGGRGDCEDYAMAKTKALLDAGFQASKMAVSVVLDRGGNNHAVLLVRLSGGDFVLDSLTSTIKPWDQTGYTFLARQKFDHKAAWEVTLSGPRAKQFNEI